jgi:hypothetical protein
MSPILEKNFEFGPGAQFPRSNMRTFYVPARSSVAVAIKDVTLSTRDGRMPIFVEVLQASPQSIGSTGPDGPVLHVENTSAPINLSTIDKNFVSNFGCPSSWRVRVRAAISPVFAKVSGKIIFSFTPPGEVKLKMVGADTQHLDPNVSATRTIEPVSGAIAGTGNFRIKAKWHTDPLDIFHLNHFERLRVALLKPNGVIAASERGYSQHAPAQKTPKIDFRYSVTPEDAALTGKWKLKIDNNPEVRIVDFDMDRGSDPNPGLSNFTSVFQATCF